MNKTNTTKRGDAETEQSEHVVASPDPVSESSTETERLRTENETLKMAIKLRNAREQITQSLVRYGALSPGLLFDSAQANLQFDENGQVTNGAALLEHLKKMHPEQFRPDRPQNSIDGGAGGGSPAAYLTKEALSRMTSTEIAKLDWHEVRRVLSER
ncbi:MAG: hypothetical protein H7070_04405 [Saprospiraceae bacterium]|nr:hypothetical protein [Pyrinomonadaceae bacterium]